MEDHPLVKKGSEVVAQGAEKGIEWVALRAPIYGAVNGYVKVPDNHPWYDMHEIGQGVDMGVPFGECTWQEGNWFGFDTLHGGQSWPESPLKFDDDVQMTDDLAISWTRQAARNAASYITTGTHSI